MELLEHLLHKLDDLDSMSNNLTAWLLSTNNLKRKVFLSKLENYSKPLGENVHRKITLANFENSIAGVVEGKLIPIMRRRICISKHVVPWNC
jgi:hypothetical protein